MMGLRRPWQVWLAYGICVSMVIAAMGWVSAKVLELDANGQRALQQAQLEERVRLALWRLDSVAAPIISAEAAQPYFTYRAFYPAGGAYTDMFGDAKPGDALLPSPLLGLSNDVVRLHFQRGPDGVLSSPQVPQPGKHREAALAFIDADDLARVSTRLVTLSKLLGPTQLDALAAHLPDALSRPTPGPPLRLGGNPPPKEVVQLDNSLRTALNNDQVVGQQQVALNANEYQQRQVSYGSKGNFQANTNIYNPRQKKSGPAPTKPRPAPTVSAPTPAEGAMTPVWQGEQLVLARWVALGKTRYLQGAWLNWEALESRLLGNIQDLLPNARLSRTAGTNDAPTGRRLASLPLVLDPGASAPAGVSGMTPLELSLLIAWGALLLGAFAVGGLLRAALVLSERRGAFVSAVTHELRTPLTTFRMYTEMLASGMVTEPAKQQRYVETLHAEAERLGHLVENVLAYARLERRPDAAQTKRIDVGGLLEHLTGRLAQRAAQVNLELRVVTDGAQGLAMLADPGAIERILFNLVDNACKYAAADSEPRVIELRASRANSANVALTVRDFGPGIESTDLAAIFRPFHKSAKKAAQTAPGVGLGLALCRRLALAMRGHLRLRPPPDGRGACFELTVPLA